MFHTLRASFFGRVNRKSLWRFAWAALLLLHIPATLKVFSSALFADSGSWYSAVAIALTNLYFVGEIAFAWSLRIFDDRRKIIIFLMIIAVLHVGVIDHAVPSLGGEIQSRFWMVITVGAIAFLAVEAMLILQRVAASVLLDERKRSQQRQYSLAVAPLVAHQTMRQIARTLPDRAPPAC